MKKLLFCLTLIILILSFGGCSYNAADNPFSGKKPNNYYYTDLLLKKFNSASACSIKIYETNLHKEMQLPQDETESIKKFFKSVNQKSFISPNPEMQKKAQYRIYVAFENEKYVVNVYDGQYASVQPWDGIYDMDFIDMSNIYPAYNLQGLCKYFFK